MTKDEIINCTDGQAIADAVAVEVMGWKKTNHGRLDGYSWYRPETDDFEHHWQPHKPTEKGKAQAIDLAAKFKVVVYPESGCALILLSQPHVINEDSWQIAVLKAALLTVKE